MSLESTELQRLKELTVVDAVARIITSTLDIQDVYAEFAQQLRLLVDFDCVAIAVIDHDAGTMEHKYAYGEPQNVYSVVPLVRATYGKWLVVKANPAPKSFSDFACSVASSRHKK